MGSDDIKTLIMWFIGLFVIFAAGGVVGSLFFHKSFLSFLLAFVIFIVTIGVILLVFWLRDRRR